MKRTPNRAPNTVITLFVILSLALIGAGGIAYAHDGPLPGDAGEVIADGFNGPQGVLVDAHGLVWVIDSGLGGETEVPWVSAESGEEVTGLLGNSARVARIDPHDGSVETVANLPSVLVGMEAVGGARLTQRDGVLYATSGQGIGSPDTEAPENMGAVVRIDSDGTVTAVANIWDFERAQNPDPALYDSHPYGLTPGPDGYLYVADAGANDLLKVNSETGEVALVAVFDPLPGVFPRPERGGEMLTDPVPTAVVFDEEGNAFVSFLSGAPFVPGSAKVVKVTPEGEVNDYATGYTMLTDLRWGPDGALYGVQFGMFTEEGPVPNSGALVHIKGGEEFDVAVEGLSFPTSVDFNAEGDAFITINGVGPPGSGAVVAFRGVAASAAPAHAEGVHWGYEGEEGPAHWGDLSPDFAACAEGKEQSPVDIPSTAVLNPADIAFAYQPTALNILNNGHTIQVNYDAGSSIELDGVTYELKQFHFHALSEHTVDGAYAAMEMHLVHQSADGGFAVIGVLIDKDGENGAYTPVWDYLPTMAGEVETIEGVSVNVSDLLPGERTYWRYSGSFTTPPCTEGVKWLMLNNRVDLSEDQVAAFEAIMHDNFRPVQPLNDREFFLSSPEAAPPEMLPVTGGELADPSRPWLPWTIVVVVVGVAGYAALRRRTT